MKKRNIKKPNTKNWCYLVPVLKLISTFWESVLAAAVLWTTSFILTVTVPVEALPKVTALVLSRSENIKQRSHHIQFHQTATPEYS